jgi:HupE / UreJ protein
MSTHAVVQGADGERRRPRLLPGRDRAVGEPAPVAHSPTLSLAALQAVVIASAIIKPAIAASVVYVATENFFSREFDRRWRVPSHSA